MSAVIVIRGRHKCKVGQIAGELGKLNSHVSKVRVKFNSGGEARIAVQDLATPDPELFAYLKSAPQQETSSNG